jgi:hypothetical protein
MDIAQAIQLMNNMGQGGGPPQQPQPQPQPNPAEFQNPGMPQQAMPPQAPPAMPTQRPTAAGGVSGPGADQQRMMMDYFMRMGQLDPERQQAMRQQAMADQLRKAAPMPGQRSSGRFLTRTNPTELLANVGGNIGGAYMGGQAEKGMESYGQQSTDTLKKLQEQYFKPTGV